MQASDRLEDRTFRAAEELQSATWGDVYISVPGGYIDVLTVVTDVMSAFDDLTSEYEDAVHNAETFEARAEELAQELSDAEERIVVLEMELEAAREQA